MAFTDITITHGFAAGGSESEATGTVTFQLTRTMTNGAESHLAGETITNTISSGVLSQPVPANDDTATVSIGNPQWAVTIRLAGEQARNETYFITVPHAAVGGTVDLFTLIPTQVQVG